MYMQLTATGSLFNCSYTVYTVITVLSTPFKNFFLLNFYFTKHNIKAQSLLFFYFYIYKMKRFTYEKVDI